MKKEAGTLVEISFNEAKIYTKKLILYELIEVEGRLLGEKHEGETTGSSRAPGKRPRNGNQFSIRKKISRFLSEKF